MSLRLRLSLGAATLVALALLWQFVPVGDIIDGGRRWIVGLGSLGYLVFAAIYVVGTLFVGPAGILTASAGFAWGLLGIPIVVSSATLAAAVAFLLGRTVARERVHRFIARDARLRAIERAVSDGGWRVVALLRLSPLVPFGLQNYLLSVSGVRFLPYTVATAIAIVPSSSLLVYIGKIGRDVDQGVEAGPLRWMLLGMGLAATAFAIRMIARRAQAVLAAETVGQVGEARGVGVCAVGTVGEIGVEDGGDAGDGKPG